MRTASALVKPLLPRRLLVSRLRRSAGRQVLLTFDDGPHPTTTPAVLDLLRRHDARAVFFIIGERIVRAPHLLSRIVKEGHWIGNHTWSHAVDRRLSFLEYLRDLRRVQDVVGELTGSVPRFHRPPAGRVTAASLLAPSTNGLVTMHWSRSPEDWRIRSDEAALTRARELSAEVEPRDIILLHDEKPHTLVLLEELLPALRRAGLGLSPESECLT